MKKQIKKQWFVVGLVGLAIAGSIFTAGNAGAAPGTRHAPANMVVSASILPDPTTCSVSAVGPVFSGTLSVNGSRVNANGEIRVHCSAGASYNVAMDAGSNMNNGNTNRILSNGAGGLIAYTLHKEQIPSNLSQWGDNDVTPGNTYALGSSQSGIGNGEVQPLTVYGVLVIQDNTVSGDYTDTVLVTVHF